MLYRFLGSSSPELSELIFNKDNYYLTFKQKKRNGKYRRIDAPQGRLKEIQNIILYDYLYKFKAHDIAHGFIKGRSPKTNAMMHLGAETLITMDIKNFFNSLTYLNIYRLYEYLFAVRPPYGGYRGGDISVFTEISTHKDALCQGAPTSPVLSNLLLLKFDKMLSRMAIKLDVTITRYADDIAISSKKVLDSEEIRKIIRGVTLILSSSTKLKINSEKTKVRRKHQRMEITGVVINEKPNVKRTNWRNFRAKLHNILKAGEPLDEKELLRIRGYIEWVGSLNRDRGNQFLKQYELISQMQ